MKLLHLYLLGALLFILLFAMALLFHTGINSDVLYPFSFLTDLLRHVPVKQWIFPGPLFFFPDMLVSLPIVAMVKTPQLWAIVFGYLQIIAMVSVIAYFHRTTASHSDFSIRFISATYVTIFVYVLGSMLFHDPWTMIADKSVLAVHHFSSALLALWIFFIIRPQTQINKVKMITLFVLACVMGFSDPLFIYFLAGLYLPYFIQYHFKWWSYRPWVLMMAVIFASTLVGIFLNLYLNPGLSVELTVPSHHASLFYVLDHFINFKKVMGWYGINVVFTVPILLFMVGYNKKNNMVMHLSSSMLLMALGYIIFGLVKDHLVLLRYINIDFPIMIYCVLALLPAQCLQWTTSWIAAFLMLVLGVYYAHSHFQDYQTAIFSKNLQSLLRCKALEKNMKGSVFVATYSPAKVVFEYFNRSSSLVQVNSTLQQYDWINNLTWQKQVYRPKAALISTMELDPTVIDQLKVLPKAQIMCRGELIRVPIQMKLFTLAPSLKQYQK
jgi:hypothetical protein